MPTTSLSLPDELEQQIAHAAQELGISTHAFMLDAIAQAAEAIEQRSQFIAKAQTARAEMLQRGTGHDANKVRSYLRGRLSNNQAERPEEEQIGDEQQWNEKHAGFISAYNRLVEEDGVALQEWRAF